MSGRQVGFDSSIASQLQSVLSIVSGQSQASSLNFEGSSIGSNLQLVSSNWDQSISANVHAAWVAAQLAVLPPSVLGL